MLNVKLAKEAIFGEEVMRRCTPGGTPELLALPNQELYQLKKLVFSQYSLYWKCLHEFEWVLEKS